MLTKIEKMADGGAEPEHGGILGPGEERNIRQPSLSLMMGKINVSFQETKGVGYKRGRRKASPFYDAMTGIF